MSMFETVNLIEGIFWICIGVCFLVSLVRRRWWWVKILAVAVFLAFGISDFVEMRTGAWWRPWWLFAWKTLCVGLMLAMLIYYYRRRKQTKGNGNE